MHTESGLITLEIGTKVVYRSWATLHRTQTR